MAPRVVLEPNVVPINGLIALRDLIQIRDLAPGRNIQVYRFRDNGAAGGRFEIGGAIQPANVWLEVPRLQFSSVNYRGGAQIGSEGYSVQVYDGVEWSNLATSTITTGNARPTLTTQNGRVNPFDRVLVSNFFNYFDADGDAAVRYEFQDLDASAQGGYFELRGLRVPSANWFSVTPAEIPQLRYRGGTFGRQVEGVSMRVFDGFSWSPVVSFQMATTAAPVVSGNPVEVVAREKIRASSLFSYFDADGDAPFSYMFIDRRPNASGGYFEFKGQRMTSGQWFTVMASELNQLFYVGANFGGQSEDVGILVYDGFQWSEITDIPVVTLNRPAVVANDIAVQANHYINVATGRTANSIISPDAGTGSPFLSFSDTVTRIRIMDQGVAENGGHFVLSGARIPSGTWVQVTMAQLDQLEYRGGTFGPQGENLFIQPFGQGVWGDVVRLRAETLPNLHAPELRLFSVRTQLGSVMPLSSLFTVTDRDGDLMQTFGIFDTGDDPNSGFFSINGVRQAPRNWIVLPFDQVDTVQYHFSNEPALENIRMWVSDGFYSSGGVTATMESVPRPRYEAVEKDISIDTLESVRVNSLFTKMDVGPAYTQFQVFDENARLTPDRSARFYLRGTGPGNAGQMLTPGVVHTLSPAEFARLDIQGAEADFGRRLDGLIVRATNGVTGWSDWQRINVNTDATGADALTSGNRFSAVIDGDKTVITFSFIDGGNQENSPRDNPNRPPLPWYYPALPETSEALNPHALGQPAREAMRQIFREIETFANVNFVERPYQWNVADAAIIIGAWGPFDGALASAAAYAYYPTGGDGRAAPAGDIWFNLGSFPWDTTDTLPGSSFHFTAAHEIGHALGLKHPFQGTPNLSIFNDYNYNTVMSYQSGLGVSAPTNPLENPYPGIPGGYMLYDIVELQRVYGANMNHRPGDDTYRFARNDTTQRTLWDAGGNNTINLQNSISDERIDLRQGQFSSIHGVPSALRIAYGTVIQNARTGIGNDTLIGNEEVNILRSIEGDNIFRGMGGNDHLYGGTGNDTYIWSLGDGHDRIYEVPGGRDIVEFHDPSGAISSFDDDFMLRRVGNNLRIDLTLDLGPTQGSVTVMNYADPTRRVETLKMFSRGNQVAGDIDLTSAWSQVGTAASRFRVTNQQSEFGFLLAPV
jgi:serralysin